MSWSRPLFDQTIFSTMKSSEEWNKIDFHLFWLIYLPGLIIMKIVIKAVEGYLRQPFPSLVVDPNHKKGYKYVINMPAQTQRYLSQHEFVTTNKMVYLFTKTHTSTVSGLPCALYHNIMLFQDSYSKIYGDSRLLEYIEELKYKMGYGIAHFSYCSWKGENRKGITSRSIIRELAKRVDFSQRYEELQ